MNSFTYCPYCAHKLLKGNFGDRQRNYCPECSFVHYLNPLPATVAIAQLENKILLIKRGFDPGKGLWTLPSGFMEAGETPEQCCLRELKEETGMEGEIIRLINVYHEFSKMYGDVLNIAYYVKLIPGIPEAGDDADNVALVPINEVTDLGFRTFNLAFQELFSK